MEIINSIIQFETVLPIPIVLFNRNVTSIEKLKPGVEPGNQIEHNCS